MFVLYGWLASGLSWVVEVGWETFAHSRLLHVASPRTHWFLEFGSMVCRSRLVFVDVAGTSTWWPPSNLVVPPPDDAAVEAVLRRLLRQLARRWPAGEAPRAEDEYQRLQEEAVQERLGLHVETRPRRRLVAVLEGFSLHAGTWCTETTGKAWSGWRGTARGGQSESRD